MSDMLQQQNATPTFMSNAETVGGVCGLLYMAKHLRKSHSHFLTVMHNALQLVATSTSGLSSSSHNYHPFCFPLFQRDSTHRPPKSKFQNISC